MVMLVVVTSYPHGIHLTKLMVYYPNTIPYIVLKLQLSVFLQAEQK